MLLGARGRRLGYPGPTPPGGGLTRIRLRTEKAIRISWYIGLMATHKQTRASTKGVIRGSDLRSFPDLAPRGVVRKRKEKRKRWDSRMVKPGIMQDKVAGMTTTERRIAWMKKRREKVMLEKKYGVALRDVSPGSRG